MNILLLLLQVSVVHMYTTNVYRIVLERLVVAESNKQYGYYTMHMSKVDRYTRAGTAYIVLEKPWTSTFAVNIRVFEFLNNEYRPFAINYKRSMCSFLEMEYKTMIYPDLVKIGAQMPGPKCPIPVGNYSFENYVPHTSNFPVDLPFKNPMVEFRILDNNTTVAAVHAYTKLDRDVIIRESFA